MKTKTVSTADFIRHFGRYHDEAQRQPLTLTKHGRPSVVVISTEQYARLTGMEDTRRVYGIGDTPPELAEILLEEIDRKITDLETHQDD